MIESILDLIGIVLAVVGYVLLAVGAPMFIYFAVRMAYCKQDLPRRWHDLWGLNRINLLFFPSQLSEKGKYYRGRALWAVKLILVAAICGISAMFILGEFGMGAIV